MPVVRAEAGEVVSTMATSTERGGPEVDVMPVKQEAGPPEPPQGVAEVME